jgi:uncharacterized membrane protein YdbT with pleckstrin-like domain
VNSEEKLVYEGGPSQVINYNFFIGMGFLFLLSLLTPLVWGAAGGADSEYDSMVMTVAKLVFFMAPLWSFWKWMVVRCHRYRVTTERLTETIGVFSRHTEELELYRVKDITHSEPLSLRIFGCGNIILETSDKSTPVVVLHAVKNARSILDQLRHNVENMRMKRGVREID